MTAPALRPPTTHELKCWPGDFEAIRLGMLTADLRRCDDRTFHVGDVLLEREYEPQSAKYSGRLIRLRITRVDRMAGPRMICAVGVNGADDVTPFAMLSFVAFDKVAR